MHSFNSNVANLTSMELNQLFWSCHLLHLLIIGLLLISIKLTESRPVPNQLSVVSVETASVPEQQMQVSGRSLLAVKAWRRRREVDLPLGCKEDEFYDGVVQDCTRCADICKPAKLDLSFCMRNCLEFYREHISRPKSNHTNSISDLPDNKPLRKDKDKDNLHASSLPVRSTEKTLVFLQLPGGHPPQTQAVVMERLIDKPLFWTSVVSLFVAVIASVFMVVLCLWRRKQFARRGGRRLYVRQVRALLTNSEGSADDKFSKKNSRSDDGYSSNSNAEREYDKLFSTVSLLVSQQTSASGMKSTVRADDALKLPKSLGETCDSGVRMPSASAVHPDVMRPQEFEEHNRPVNNRPGHNIHDVLSRKAATPSFHDKAMTSRSLCDSLVSSLNDYEVVESSNGNTIIVSEDSCESVVQFTSSLGETNVYPRETLRKSTQLKEMINFNDDDRTERFNARNPAASHVNGVFKCEVREIIRD